MIIGRKRLPLLALAALVCACTRADSGLAQFNREISAIDPLVPKDGQRLDATELDALSTAMFRLGFVYRKLNESDQAAAMRDTPDRLRSALIFGIRMAEKDEIISKGWGHPRAYYARIFDAARVATPPDGNDHAFSVIIAGDRVSLTTLPGPPEARGAATSTLMARMVDGKLTAGYVFDDMGHAGIWGILFCDADVPLHTSAFSGGPRYWMFSDVGNRIFPHVYQAWNSID